MYIYHNKGFIRIDLTKSVATLTVFAAAEPPCHRDGQVELLPGSQRQELKLLYRPDALVHLVAWRIRKSKR